jgi:hypothetical protein
MNFSDEKLKNLIFKVEHLMIKKIRGTSPQKAVSHTKKWPCRQPTPDSRTFKPFHNIYN